MIILGWIICFGLFELIRIEIIYQSNKVYSFKEVFIKWHKVLIYLGLVFLFGLSSKTTSYSMLVMALGTVMIAIDFYIKAVQVYTLTDHGIIHLNNDYLISREAIKNIHLKDYRLNVETLNETGVLVLHINKDTEQKEVLIREFIDKNYISRSTH